MVERKVIIDKIVGFANAKLSELSSTNPVVLIARPYIARVINNNIAKFDSLLKLAQDDNGIVCRGEVFTVEDAKAIYDKHVRNINREITYWDVYVAVNAQYHDYVRLYQDWFPNLTEEQLDEKVIYSAINFWFKDEDAGTGKVWNYFKEI